MTLKAFINYRRGKDSPAAKSLYHCLQRKFGKSRLFMDLAHLEGGEAWAEAIDKHVSGSFAMAALIGPDWLKNEEDVPRLSQASDSVRYEIATALRRKVPVIPVLLDDTKLPAEQELPQDMRGMLAWQAMPLRFSSFEEDAAKLAEALSKHLPPRRLPPWAIAAGTAVGALVGLVGGYALAPQLTTASPVAEPELMHQVQTLRGNLETADKRLADSSKQLAERDAKLADSSKQLADRDARIKGLEARRAPVPEARPSTAAQLSTPYAAVRALQERLNALGYYNGGFEGVPGERLLGALRSALSEQAGPAGASAAEDIAKFRELWDRARSNPGAGQNEFASFVSTLLGKLAPGPASKQRLTYADLDASSKEREIRQYGSFPFDGDQAEMRLQFNGPWYDRFIILDNDISIDRIDLCKRRCSDLADNSPDKKTIERNTPLFKDSGSKFSFVTDRFVTKVGEEFKDTMWLRLHHTKSMSKGFNLTVIYRNAQ